MEELDEVVNVFIKEEDYQKIKIIFHKNNDYFSKEELEKYGIKFWRNFDVIYNQKNTLLCFFMLSVNSMKTLKNKQKTRKINKKLKCYKNSHNPKVAGSSPAPATKKKQRFQKFIWNPFFIYNNVGNWLLRKKNCYFEIKR